ncbi:amino acid ABC transporter ATP-binding protein [Fusobacterium sp. IOR10]|uniref:amino acid ABC transporter ATP-binding protein n=1 Tax=Fusobacterium sp. IOR10 TaxID=2665157 RepID=UPI0013D11C4F|nr:ATP-binding cassette domain-containing protein [Fusobacterium sp. IOR10]
MKVKLTHLNKDFGKNKEVFSNINFHENIHSLAIIGPSGGGKSTLLKIIGGLIPPSSGEMSIDDEEISFNEDSLSSYRKKIGFVFQHSGLFKHMTAIDNIKIPLIHVHNYSEKDAQTRAWDLLKRFGLEKDALKKPNELSGGQQQRISIARAVAPKPKFLLFDEPTSALDPEYTVEVLDIINELKKDGIDFIIVTHEMGFARHACEKVAFLADGSLLEFGESEEVFKNPKNLKLKKFLSKLLEWNI